MKRRHYMAAGLLLAIVLLGACSSSTNRTAKCAAGQADWLAEGLEDEEMISLARKACGEIGGAQYLLGLAYERGTFGPIDLTKAAQWYESAADPRSGTTRVYIPAVGNQKHGQVLQLNPRPFSVGHADAQYRLGLLFLDGRGVKQSRKKAKKWLKRAARQGHQEAAQALERLESETREIGR